MLDTANITKIFNENDFPKPEDFIMASTGGALEKNDTNQNGILKENLDEVVIIKIKIGN